MEANHQDQDPQVTFLSLIMLDVYIDLFVPFIYLFVVFHVT